MGVRSGRKGPGRHVHLSDTAYVPALNPRSGILQVVEPSDSIHWLMKYINGRATKSGRSVLSHEQEMALGRQIRRLEELEAVRDALAEQKTSLDDKDSVSMAEWAEAMDMSVHELKKTIRKAKEARAEMIKSNLALVVSIAKCFRNRGLPMQDLIQEGAVGLAVAAARYDPAKGFRFSTYATWWIRQKIQRAVVDSGRVIRLPAHLHDLKQRAGKEWKNLEEALGRPPSMEELARELGVTSARLATVVGTEHTVFSMDRRVDQRKRDSATTLGDLLPCESPCPEELVQRFTLREVIDSMISRLGEREASILRMRFGLDDGQPKTVSEVGAKHCCTKERVRLIENRALFKLRSRSSNALRELMEIEDLQEAGMTEDERSYLEIKKLARRGREARAVSGKASGAAEVHAAGRREGTEALVDPAPEPAKTGAARNGLRSISKRSRASTSLRRPQ
eukprot:scaffold2061_cov246-Pinguiococcus_pyrenoidosus.AAC.13